MAKATLVRSALDALREYEHSGAPQPGMFSVLDEAIQAAPFETAPGSEWVNYLQPGRMIEREGVQFPLRKSELISLDSEIQEGLGDFIGGKHKYTKEEMLELIREERPQFSISVSKQQLNPVTGKLYDVKGPEILPENWLEMGRADVDEVGAFTSLGQRIDVANTRWGQNEPTGGSRYSHHSPGSVYEESVTRMPGVIDFSSHYGNDALSWSRTSTHNAPAGRVRLVEEIQTDLHQKARKPIWVNKRTGAVYDREYTAKQDPDYEDLVKEKRGYMEVWDEMDIDEWKADAAKLREDLNDIRGPERLEVMDRIKVLEGEIARGEMRVSDAPFKTPQEYSALELRKQLLNAVNDDADYLALTTSEDQFARYGGGEARRAGMEATYDQIYWGELRKLARRYKIPITEVEVPVGTGRDIRPQILRDMDWEEPAELIEDVTLNIDEATDMRSAVAEVDKYRFFADQIQELLAQEGRSLGSVNYKYLIRDIEDLQSAIGQNWDDAAEDLAGGVDNYINVVDPRKAKVEERLLEYYQKYIKEYGHLGSSNKTFPAIELTPEVKELIDTIGVPMAQAEGQKEGEQVVHAALGGLIRKYYEGGPVHSLQAEDEGIDIEAARESYRKSELRKAQDEAEDKKKDAELRRRWEEGDTKSGNVGLDYLKAISRSLAGAVPFIDDSSRQWLSDTMNYVPVGAGSMLQSLQDDGTAEMLLPIPLEQPSPFMSEEQLMSMIEYNKMAREHNARINPNIIDDTKAIAALPGMFFPDTFGSPEWADEAMMRSEQVTQDVRDDFGVPRPEGFIQGAAEGLGMMMAQVPVPGSQGKTGATKLFNALGKATSPGVATTAKVATFPARAAVEFFNPTIRPGIGNYLMGAGFAGALNKGADVLGGDEEEGAEQLSEQELKYREYATDTWTSLDFDGKMDLLADPQVGDAAWFYLDPGEKALFMEHLKEQGYAIEEEGMEEDEAETEWAKGGYVKRLAKLKKMKDGVIDASDVFEQKMLDDAIEEAGLGDLADEPNNIIGLYDDIKVESTEYLPPTPEFQKWLDQFQRQLDEKNAARDVQMAATDFRFKEGDIVMGDKFRHEIIFKDVDKNGEPFYRVRNLDQDAEYDLPESAISGRFKGPEGVE